MPTGEVMTALDLAIDGIEDAAEIGRGGFATVYAASQPQFKRTVAVKVLDVGALDEENQHRFERECEAMGTLSSHPRIVTVHDAGVTADGRPFLVMEHMSGGSVGDRLRSQGAIPWREAIDIAINIAQALDAAHGRGVIHRDVKPDNILVSEFGEAQLSDFGIARVTGGQETRAGVVTASLSHAPPEVLEGSRPTAQSDIYSLASTLYAMIAGTTPFERSTDETQIPQIRRIIAEAPAPLEIVGMPAAVASVVERGLAKDPAARPRAALEFGIDLARAASGNGASGGPDSAETRFVPSVDGPGLVGASRTYSSERGSKARILVVVSLVTVAAIALVLLLVRQGGEAGSAADSTAPGSLGQSSTTLAATSTTAEAVSTTIAGTTSVPSPPTTVFVPVEDRHIIVLGSVDKATTGPGAADQAGRDLLGEAGIPPVRVRILDSDNFASLASGLWVVSINEFFPTLDDAATACWNFGLTDVSECFARPLNQDPADASVIAPPAP